MNESLHTSHSCKLQESIDWSKRTYYPRLSTPKNAWINWSWEGDAILRFCNAFDSPYPGAKTLHNGQEIALTNAELDDEETNHHPYCVGLILRISRAENKFWIAISNGSLKVNIRALNKKGAIYIEAWR